MEQYSSEKKITFSPEQEERFREIFNRWCLSEQGYDGKPIGNDIEILEVVEAPVYAASLQSQYDQRIIERRAEPTYSQFTATITKNSDVDIWQRATLPQNFIQKDDEIIINESRNTTTCTRCNGRRSVTCPECNGSGTVMKTEIIKTTCRSCNGSGKTSYTTTETYWVDDGGKKYTSGGTGLRMASKTVVHTAQCGSCKGNGYHTKEETSKVTCSSCRGKGVIECPTCHGSGQMMHYMYIARRLFHKTVNRYIAPSMLNADETREIYPLVPSSAWHKIEQFHIERTDFNHCEASGRPIVGKMINRLFVNVKDEDYHKVCFSVLTTFKADAIAVRYSYNGKEYRCVLLGDDWRLFAVKSPISDFADELRAEVLENTEKKAIGSAWKNLRRVMQFSQTSAKDRQALELIEKRMALTANYGKLTACILSMFVLYPILIDIFSNYNIVAPWTSLLDFFYSPTVDAPFRAAVSLALYFWFIKYTKIFRTPRFCYLHSQSAVRFSLGFAWGIISTIGTLPIVLACNYLGIIHIFMLLIIIVLGIIGSAITFLIFIISTIVYSLR